MRGRNNNNNSSGNNNGNRKSPNPLQRSYESNGPDVKVRGTAQHVAEKYLQLARDAQSSGDPVAAENYFQHAEHYYRILLAAQEQMSQQFGHSFPLNRAFNDDVEDGDEEGEDDNQSQNQNQNYQAGNGPQPDIRAPAPQNGGGNGYNGNAGPRHDGESGDGQPHNGQRFDRPNRNNNDRNSQDRSGQDRSGQDRSGQDRNGNRRFDRNDRNDRGERRFDRPEGGQSAPGGYAPRPDAPRSDIPVVDEKPDAVPEAQPRFERPERSPRPERRPRRERDADSEPTQDVAAALPSFLTTPVRIPPAAVAESAVVEAPSVPQPVDGDVAEAAPKRPRRRRSPREVMDALGSESDNTPE